MLLGHPIDLKAKVRGEKSMSEKRGSLEGAEGVVPQDPRERRKLHCLNPNPQRCKSHTRCYGVYNAAPPGADRTAFAIGHLRLAGR